MRPKLLYPTFVLAAFCCLLAAAQLPSEKHPGKNLPVGRANPALEGIEKLYVVLEPLDTRPSKDGLVWANLQTLVEKNLEKAGLKTEPGVILGKGARDPDIPELRVCMDLLKFTDSNIYVFRAQTALAAKAQLPEKNLFFKARVWQSAPAIKGVDLPVMPDAVTNTILSQTNVFIAAWLAANPSAQENLDPNDIAALIKPVSKTKISSKTKPPVQDYRFVASKNSRIFHRPDCPFAKRIKPENLTGYKSRTDAIKAGKRPCRRCKP